MFDQDEQDFSQIVEAGVELILSGKATLEQVLARYPDQAEEIRPELEVAIWLSSRSQEVAPRPGFVSASRRRVVDRIKQEAKSTGKKHAFMGIAWPKRLSFQWVAVALVLLVLFSGTGGMVTFAQGAVPGENLYPVKRASETVAYTVTFTDTRRVELSARFAERRLDEAGQLMEISDYQAVEAVLKEYGQEITRTAALIQIIGVSNAPQAAALARDYQATLSKQALVVQEMQSAAPADIVSAFNDAQDAIQESLALVVDLSDGIFDLPTVTTTVTLTVTPSFSPSPLVTDTPVPPLFTFTPLPSDPMDDEYPLFGDTMTQTAVADEANSDSELPPAVQPSKTPKPTNVNKEKVPGLTDNPSDDRPTQKPKPTKKDK